MKYKFLIALFIVLFTAAVQSGTAFAGSANLSWNANTESDLGGYKIYYGTSPRTSSCPSGGYANNIDVGNTTSHTFSNLADGSTYYFSVSAYDTSGNESCFSGEVNKTIPSIAAYSIISLKTLSPINIDGNLSEAVWNQANYVDFSNSSKSDNKVRAYTLYDDTNLYFAFSVTDVQLEAINAGLWADDGAEIYLDTGNDKTTSIDSNDYHFIANINGLTFGGNISAKTSTNASGYTMEIAIPWTEINTTPAPNKIMGILLGNNDRDNGSYSQFDWTNLVETGSYSRPNLWGDITLSSGTAGYTDTQPPQISNVSVSDITTDSAAISFKTDEPASSYIEYGPTVSYGKKTPTINNSSDFVFNLSDLSDSTSYNYRITSTDTSGNVSQSSNHTFLTLKAAVLDTTPPSKITNFTASNITQTSVNLSWTSPGDDGNSGTASSYDIRYGTSIINDSNWVSAVQVAGEPNPKTAGAEQYISVGLSPSTTYYFGVKTSDEAGNFSPISNILKITTLASSGGTGTGTGGGGGTVTGGGGGTVTGGGGGGGGYFVDTTPPGQVKNFVAMPSDSQISLKWQNPKDADFVRVLVVKKQGSAPISRSDGKTIYEGDKEEFTDINLDNNKTYYYAAYTYDKKPNYSQPVIISASPVKGKTVIQIVQHEEKKFHRELKGPFAMGMENEQVKLLQQILASDPEIYPEGTTSGYYGRLTKKAIQRFQCKYNIVCHGDLDSTGYGLAGPATRAKINEVYGSSSFVAANPSPTSGVSSASPDKQKLIAQVKEMIKQLQMKLVELLGELVKALQKKL